MRPDPFTWPLRLYRWGRAVKRDLADLYRFARRL